MNIQGVARAEMPSVTAGCRPQGAMQCCWILAANVPLEVAGNNLHPSAAVLPLRPYLRDRSPHQPATKKESVAISTLPRHTTCDPSLQTIRPHLDVEAAAAILPNSSATRLANRTGNTERFMGSQPLLVPSHSASAFIAWQGTIFRKHPMPQLVRHCQG